MGNAPPHAEVGPRPLTGGAVMAGASRLTVAATSALTTVVIARMLGPEGSGAYALAQNLLLVLTVATTLGLQNGIAYYVSAGAWASRPAAVAGARIALVAGLVGAALAVAARLLAPSAFAGLPLWATAVVAAGIPFALTWFFVSFAALAIDRYEAYVLPPALQSTLALVLAAPAAAAFGVEGAVVGLAVSGAVVAVGMVCWAWRALPAEHMPDPPGMLRRAVSFGIKGYVANALQQLNYRLDLFILSAVASAALVGQYAVAFAVTSVLWLLPMALSEVLFPRVAQLSARPGDDAQVYREMVEVKALRHVTLAVLVMTLLLAAVLAVLVVPIYGEQFRPAIELGLILLPGVGALGIAGVLSATIVGRGKPLYSLYIVLMTTPVTVALYATLIPWLEARGAAAASTGSYVATLVLSALFYRRVTGRRVTAVLAPTRSELEDLRALPGAVRTWLRTLRS